MESSAGQGPPPCPPGGNQSQLVCGGCAVLLMYPQGASNVRCSRCTYINPVAGRDMAQLVCQGCRVLLMYPRGANSVQCSLCSSINPAQQPRCYKGHPLPTQANDIWQRHHRHRFVTANAIGHVVCGGCHITLMYAHGAHQVKCAVCNHLTSINSSTSNAPAPTSTVQHVFIENPPSLDEHGNEVSQSIAADLRHSHHTCAKCKPRCVVVNIAVGLTEKPVPASSSA